MLSGTNLSGADLSDVNFTNAFLQNCNLEMAVMKDVQFGVFPDFKCNSGVNTIAMSKNGYLLVCGTENGQV